MFKNVDVYDISDNYRLRNFINLENDNPNENVVLQNELLEMYQYEGYGNEFSNYQDFYDAVYNGRVNDELAINIATDTYNNDDDSNIDNILTSEEFTFLKETIKNILQLQDASFCYLFLHADRGTYIHDIYINNGNNITISRGYFLGDDITSVFNNYLTLDTRESEMGGDHFILYKKPSTNNNQ